jgi:polysaccharide biosynthesis transport protein
MSSVATATLRGFPSLRITGSECLERSSVVPRANSDIVDFTVRDVNPERARLMATAYAREYIDSRRASSSPRTSNAVLVSPAGTAEQVQPRPLRIIAFGVVMGLILGIAGAYLRNALDTNLRDVREVGSLLGLPLLGTIREYGKHPRPLAMLEAPHGPEAEAYRILRANLDFANIDRSARVVLVTGAVDGEGRSTTAANLAVAVALAGRSVVLADIDLRHPALDKLFELEGRPGLTDVALGHTSLNDALAPIQIGPRDSSTSLSGSPSLGTLHVLPSGPTPIDSGEFVGTQAVAELVSELSERADLVLLDAPPLLPVGDARTLTRIADALLIVTNLDIVRRPMLQELVQVLGAVPTRVLGFVATGAMTERPDAYSGYYRRPLFRRSPERAA